MRKCPITGRLLSGAFFSLYFQLHSNQMFSTVTGVWDVLPASAGTAVELL